MNQATVILDKLKLPDILEKVLSYERDRKTALLRSKGFGSNSTNNDSNHNSKGEDNNHNTREGINHHNSKERGNKSTEVRSSQHQLGNEPSESQAMDFVRTEVSNDINKKKKMDENEAAATLTSSSGKKNSTSLLDMFQLNEKEDDEEEDDPIWNHFKNTKSQSLNNNNLNKSLRLTDEEIKCAQPQHNILSSTQRQKRQTLKPAHCSTRDNSPARNNITNATKRRQNIVDSPPDLGDLDNDPIWEKLTNSGTTHREELNSSTLNIPFSKEPAPTNNNKLHPTQLSCESALADTVLIPSCDRIVPDFTKFPPSSSRKKMKMMMAEKDSEIKSSFSSLKHLTDGNNKTTESQLVDRILNAQTPRSIKNQQENNFENLNKKEHRNINVPTPATTTTTTKNRFKRFTFRKKE